MVKNLRDDGNDAVPQPVGGGRQTDTAGADLQGEDLADDDPGAGAPGGGEEEDVDADEGDHGGDGLGVVGQDGADDGDDELADDHAEGAPDEDGAAAEALNGPEGDGRRAHVDQVGDERDEERVLDRAERLEEGGAKVEDEVDTGPLLHHLQRRTQNGAAQVAALLEQGALEAVEPRVEVAALGNDGQLVLVVGDDLGELVLDEVGLDGLVAEAGEGGGGEVELALLDKVAGRVGQEEQADAQDQGPEDLDGDRDAVRAAVVAVLGSVVDGRGEQETNGDAELVSGDDGAANLAGRDLGHVPERKKNS